VCPANPLPVERVLSGQTLRCGSCGAPYTGRTDGEILTCTYCGTSARMVDARQFLDHFMAQVTAFVRQAVPSGLDLSRSQTVDPVARLAAFNSGIRPRLATESDQYRLSCFRLLSSPLAVLPFSPGPTPPPGADPAKVSIFAAQVQSVSGLAVDDASRELVRRTGGVASCYQSLLVATRLSAGGQPERLHLISQDFQAASAAIDSAGRWPALSVRLAALAEECQAVDLLLSGRELGDARQLLGAAQDDLNRSRGLLSAAPELGYMVTAVDQELAVVRTIRSMLEMAERSPSVPPQPLIYAQRLSGVLDWLSQNAPGDWASYFRSSRLREAVFQRAAQLRAAQAGTGGVKIASAGGGTFVPFWVVELPYTFETGVLWTKRGKEVPETLLLAATFPTDLSGLGGTQCARVLTDVFAASRGGGAVNEYYDRLRGRQQKISESGSLAALVQGATVYSLPGQQAIPPFTTEVEALRLVQLYVDGVRSSNPKAASQLRASSPRVVELVYVPCNLQASPLVPWLGALSPSSLGDTRSLLGFIS
jgi:hypothetical protein